MSNEVKTTSFLGKYLVRILVAVTLIAVGAITVSKDPNMVETVFGGASIGLGLLASMLLYIDIRQVKSLWIIPGADQCDG